MEFIYYLDLAGTFVFALSGVLTAIDKKFDIVGSIIIGFTTAVGGGTLRDVLIGKTPVGWMENTEYVLVIFLAVPICYLFKSTIIKLRKGVFLFDTLGIGLFTILGLQKTMSLELSPLVGIMMGIVSAVFGGIIRDVLCNEVPLIFRKEIYATACLIGAVIFLALEQFSSFTHGNMVGAMIVVIVIRYMAVRHNWSLELQAK